jgi:hypothetical protein
MTMPGMGYELFWDGKRVNGPEAASYSRQEARDNCAWNTRTYPGVRVTCFYNGEPFAVPSVVQASGERHPRPSPSRCSKISYQKQKSRGGVHSHQCNGTQNMDGNG